MNAQWFLHVLRSFEITCMEDIYKGSEEIDVV
jgi:hypothetical protein